MREDSTCEEDTKEEKMKGEHELSMGGKSEMRGGTICLR